MLLRALAAASFLMSLFVYFAAPPAQNSLGFRLQDNLILVPIVLNGHSVNAVLDSGTGDVGIDRTFAASLGLNAGQSIGMVPGGGKTRTDVFVSARESELWSRAPYASCCLRA